MGLHQVVCTSNQEYARALETFKNCFSVAELLLWDSTPHIEEFAYCWPSISYYKPKYFGKHVLLSLAINVVSVIVHILPADCLSLFCIIDVLSLVLSFLFLFYYTTGM